VSTLIVSGVTVGNRPVLPHAGPPRAVSQPKLTLRGTVSSTVITVPYAPQGGTLSGIAPVWVRQPRPGRVDDVLRNNEPTNVLALDLRFLNPDYLHNMDGQTAGFRALAGGTEAVLLQGVTAAWAGPWFITEASEEVRDLQPGTNKIIDTVFHTTFTHAAEALSGVGPVTGGVQVTLLPGSTYVVKRGDTLPGIAAKQLGNANYYGLIAALNGLRSTSLYVGQKLLLPKLSK
jgi:LysM repeat protein